jgi:ornithine cyclodeaminase/alanine dehydrogenase-like protein (mu-crystallin family)
MAPQPLLQTGWIKPGALVVPYGTMSAVELSLTDIMDKVVVDDWGQCRKGLPYGALRQHVDTDRLTEQSLHAELGQIVAGANPAVRRSGNHPVLASGTELERHRTGSCPAAKGAGLERGPDASTRLKQRLHRWHGRVIVSLRNRGSP